VTAWWPSLAWGPWAALASAGVAVVDDARNVSPPCALVAIDSAELVGACSIDYTVNVHLIAPGPDHADARRWLWTVAAPPLFPYASEIRDEPWNDYPALTASMTEGGQQWP
jgi:hypothetical protein